jgi:hypothetical protein
VMPEFSPPYGPPPGWLVPEGRLRHRARVEIDRPVLSWLVPGGSLCRGAARRCGWILGQGLVRKGSPGAGSSGSSRPTRGALSGDGTRYLLRDLAERG